MSVLTSTSDAGRVDCCPSIWSSRPSVSALDRREPVRRPSNGRSCWAWIHVDWVAHDIRKFARMMTNHNGYVLEQLFSPLVVLSTPAHEELRELGKGCITRPTVGHYQGFVRGRRRAGSPQHSAMPRQRRQGKTCVPVWSEKPSTRGRLKCKHRGPDLRRAMAGRPPYSDMRTSPRQV
ncbi:MAG: nucleotidyltransferase domain-containing protein [Pseudomonadota bacterium]